MKNTNEMFAFHDVIKIIIIIVVVIERWKTSLSAFNRLVSRKGLRINMKEHR